MNQDWARMLIFSGAVLVALGIFILFRDKLPGLRHLGRLPGDIAVEKEGFRFYFPVATSLLLSLLLSALFWIFRR